MQTLILQLLPIFLYFVVGVLLKRAGLADKSHGEFLLRLVFFVTLPLLILTSVPTINLTGDKAWLPLINIAVNAICLGVMYGLARLQGLPRLDLGTALVNSGIHNNSFMFPFILAVLGQVGFADAILLDLGNSVWMATALYLVAFSFSGSVANRWLMVLRICKSPLLWSLLISIVLALTHTKLPSALLSTITPLAQMTAPLILIALGLYFALSVNQLGLALQIVGVRMAVGGSLGWLFASILGLEGVTFTVVVVCSAAPIGFTALTYSSLAKLNADLSASAVSISIATGLWLIPLLLMMLSV
jgi:malate permease and related proteins